VLVNLVEALGETMVEIRKERSLREGAINLTDLGI